MLLSIIFIFTAVSIFTAFVAKWTILCFILKEKFSDRKLKGHVATAINLRFIGENTRYLYLQRMYKLADEACRKRAEYQRKKMHG